MAYGNSIDQYRKNAVNTASPLKLVIMLYDGYVRFSHATRKAMSEKDLYQQNHNCLKAQKIVTELMSSLDMQNGGEIAQNLFALYSYVYNKLVEANIGDNLQALNEAEKVMTDLRESWVQLEAMNTAQHSSMEDSRAA